MTTVTLVFQALTRFNQQLTKNSALREELQTLHIERARFQQLRERLQKVRGHPTDDTILGGSGGAGSVCFKSTALLLVVLGKWTSSFTVCVVGTGGGEEEDRRSGQPVDRSLRRKVRRGYCWFRLRCTLPHPTPPPHSCCSDQWSCWFLTVAWRLSLR